MSEASSQPSSVAPSEIARLAESERWSEVRVDVRRQLAWTLTIGYLYLVAALAVGGYLILMVAHAGREAVYLEDWDARSISVDPLVDVAWGYAGFGVMVTIAYCLLIALVLGRGPAFLGSIFEALPWVGSTMRVTSLGEFCQSIYHSISQSKTYGDAFANAATEVRHVGLRRWSALSSQRIDSGHALTRVLQFSPLKDHPLSTVYAFSTSNPSASDSVRIWHHAAVECHLLAQSRLARAKLVVSTTCFLVSVFLAAFALFLSMSIMQLFIEGLRY